MQTFLSGLDQTVKAGTCLFSIGKSRAPIAQGAGYGLPDQFWSFFTGEIMKYFGLLICLAIIAGAIVQVGQHLYNDIMTGVFVFGGAFGFALLKNEPLQMSKNFGAGAVYFGWLGTLIGLIAISGNAFGAWDSLSAMGPALAVSMLPLLYGYTLNLVCMAIAANPTEDE